MMAARTKNGMKVSRTPWRCSNPFLCLARRLTMRVKSTSYMQWTWALVRRDSIMRWAMILRILVRGTRSPGYAAGAGAEGRDGVEVCACWLGAEAGVGAAATADGARSMKARMSCLVMRPPRPVPETWERLTPCSRAILRTSGEERVSSSPSSGDSDEDAGEV